MLTKKERNLLKGAIRRIFSRSELRRQVVENAKIEHKDESRPRVKKWAVCAICTSIVPAYKLQVDHKIPVIPLELATDSLTFDQVIDRMWCDIANLQALCEGCHTVKSKQEQKIRLAHRKERKNKARQGNSNKA